MASSSMSRYHRSSCIMLLMLMLKCADSMEVNVERRLPDSLDPAGALVSPLKSPYWEYILREFLFKTISPPPAPSNNKLYKELLEAPFYTGPFRTEGTSNYGEEEISEVLSRGDVYHLVEGGWIICQEGCTDCDICMVQRNVNVPTVKWILRKIQRIVPYLNFFKKNDLQLTVLPQTDDNYNTKNLEPGSHVYGTSNNGVSHTSFTDTLIQKNKDYSLQRDSFGTTKSTESKTYLGNVFSSGKDKDQLEVDQKKAVSEDLLPKNKRKRKNHFNGVFQTDSQLMITPTSIPMVKKRGREILRSEQNQDQLEEELKLTRKPKPLTMIYPPTTVPTIESIETTDCDDEEKNTKLILGKDQFGEKHVVHIVPAGDLDQGIMKRSSVHPGTGLVYRQQVNPLPVSNKDEDRVLYRKIFRRVIDSLKTHKNAIEKFLLSPNRDVSQHPEDEESSIIAEENPLRNYETNNFNDKTETDNETISILGSPIHNDDQKIVNRSEEITSSASAETTTELFHEDDKVSTESYHSELQLITEENQKQELNNNVEKFEESSLLDEFTKQENNSESLILKEVAKSVVKQPADTLQGFNSVINNNNSNSNLDQKSDDPVPTISIENI